MRARIRPWVPLPAPGAPNSSTHGYRMFHLPGLYAEADTRTTSSRPRPERGGGPHHIRRSSPAKSLPYHDAPSKRKLAAARGTVGWSYWRKQEREQQMKLTRFYTAEAHLARRFERVGRRLGVRGETPEEVG